MKPTLLSTPVRPNRPLRKPSSSPGLPSSTPARFPSMTAAPPVRPAGNGPASFPENTVTSSTLAGLVPPALTVYFCNFCGQQGNFRCKRCKKMPYCSTVCQTEDWKEHRHICKPVEPEPAREQPKESVALPGTGHRENLIEMKASESSSYKKVYLKDLHASKITSGIDIQATVVEFCSPDKFFILPQDPEVLEALQIISTELQKTCSSSSGTAYVPCDGEVCTVQFSVDKNWYRGLVQTVAADKKTASILYIDFGNEENVLIERILPLPANIQHFCPCAMECRIAGVVPVVNKWSDECCITVRQMLTGKAVTVKLLEATEKEGVHSVDIVLSMRLMLSSFLIKNGFGQKETTSVPPTEQDIIAMLSASFENYKRLSDGKDDNEWAQPPKPLTQAVGDQFLVVLTHFVSPSDLVVQKVENAELIRDLQLKLRDHCAQISTLQNFRPAPGTVCCAQFSEDKQWYRATVLAYPSEERVCVAYLDFGNSEEVDLSQLLPITPALLTVPMQAIPCALAGVQPVGENWSRDCILSLQCQLSNRFLRLKIHGVQEGKTLVSMVDEASDPQVDFADLLITACYATPASDSASANLPAEETTAPAETSVPPAVPEPLVWTSAELPSDGQTVTLFTSIVESPGKFYCRLANPTELKKFLELEAQLKQHCEGEASPYFPKVGEPCCAPFPGSGSWCRALVNGRSDDNVDVYLVDYGHSMTTKNSHLRSITPKLLTLPFQAVCCWLAGVDPVGSEWSSEALLWFQNLLDGEQLSARVLSITGQGYGLEVISRGQNIAAALIAEQMAKAIGEPVGAKHEQVESTTTKENGGNEQEDSVEVAGGIQTAVASEVAGFPVDWKTEELPLNESFQPYIAGVISPSLFYVLSPTQIDQKKLQEVMMEVAVYCSVYQGTLSTGMKSTPSAGAACCAQFSGDKNWYRAVILEVGENELSVIYADYGNTEKVPSSQILPIPPHLLQLPFQIIRCTLAGGENFPEEWPEEVLQACRAELVNGVLAKVQSFDGSANALSLTLPAERDGVQLTSLVLDKLNAFNKTNPDTNQKLDDAPGVPDGPQSKLVPEVQLELEHKPAPVESTGSTKPAELTIVSGEPACEESVKKIIDQMEPPYQNHLSGSDHKVYGCCCQSLKKQISNLEQVMQLQLALIKQLVGQIK
ncbi:tudor domain-containing protein 1 [Gambusia affinis]|uniref:tudor domain-containing protein 1 n=1 Tax=Gambusia affinis TaxID=33528 RepID=UPI001CDD266E|nr:tudor domain-containing protein 1 [Gambusia affinis]XP_043958018.1 tudor domain-containing protein 1 [Gambusia affinis]XP_043958019.1 tudor domain-containing protein 1 [Gambusia affinis]